MKWFHWSLTSELDVSQVQDGSHSTPHHGQLVAGETERLQSSGGSTVIRFFRQYLHAALVGVMVMDGIPAQMVLLQFTVCGSSQQLERGKQIME